MPHTVVVAIDLSKKNKEQFLSFAAQGFDKQLEKMEQEIRKICENLSKDEAGSDQWIIAWREYGLTNGVKKNGEVDRYLTTKQKSKLKQVMSKITSDYPKLTIIAGTVATKRIVNVHEQSHKLKSGVEVPYYQAEVKSLSDEELKKIKNLYLVRNTSYVFSEGKLSDRRDKANSSEESKYFDPTSDIIFMLMPDSDQHENSTLTHLYLYKDQENQIFYYHNNEIIYLKNMHPLVTAEVLRLFKEVGNNPIKCDNLHVVDPSSNKRLTIYGQILDITSKLEHTFGYETTVAFRPGKGKNNTPFMNKEFGVEICLEHHDGLMSRMMHQDIEFKEDIPRIQFVLSDSITLRMQSGVSPNIIHIDSAHPIKLITADGTNSQVFLYSYNILSENPALQAIEPQTAKNYMISNTLNLIDSGALAPFQVSSFLMKDNVIFLLTPKEYNHLLSLINEKYEIATGKDLTYISDVLVKLFLYDTNFFIIEPQVINAILATALKHQHTNLITFINSKIHTKSSNTSVKSPTKINIQTSSPKNTVENETPQADVATIFFAYYNPGYSSYWNAERKKNATLQTIIDHAKGEHNKGFWGGFSGKETASTLMQTFSITQDEINNNEIENIERKILEKKEEAVSIFFTKYKPGYSSYWNKERKNNATLQTIVEHAKGEHNKGFWGGFSGKNTARTLIKKFSITPEEINENKIDNIKIKILNAQKMKK